MASRERTSSSNLHFGESNSSSAIRPQFNVGGQVSVLRNSHPKLSSPANSEATNFSSWATTGLQTTISDFHSEMNTSRHHYLDKNDKFGGNDVTMTSQSTKMTSRSLNPELLMREFMHDEVEDDEDDSSGFKSSFAREVMQNVRKNVTHQTTPARRYLAINATENGEELFTSSTPKHGSFYSHGKENLSAAKGARLSMPAMNTSRRPPSFTSSKYRSQFAARNLLLMDDDSDDRDERAEKSGPRDDLWMTSNQFKVMLEKQELAESEVDRHLEEENAMFNETQQLFENNEENEDSTCSYLDQEAKIPFRKLKQTCDDLGFTFSEQEWSELRRLLSVDQTKRSGDDFVVRNGDFFSALHLIMSNKHSRLRRDETLKYSMKSDSGGEMESCRSSDSELERELHEKEREIATLQRELSSGFRSLAERDTELVRVRLECQRLLEDNRHLKEQTARFKLYNANPKRMIELEQEIDQLRWKLVAMEDSRRTYESATERLVVFLEQVTTMLQATSPSQRKFLESTRAEVSKIAKRTRAQNAKRFSIDSNSMFRAESMPGLNSSVASSSVTGMSNGLFHGSLLSLSTTLSGGEAPTTSSSASSHRSSTAITRRPSSATSSAIVQRSQSTQSKRSSNLPSVRERHEKTESIYVNSDIIRELIAEETLSEKNALDEVPELPRPKSAAAILHGNKRHVCEIKIGSTDDSQLSTTSTSKDKFVDKKRSTSTPAKRSNSVISSASSNNRINIPNQKASKILGLDPQQLQNFVAATPSAADSGRFSLGSRTSSASTRSSPIIPKKSAKKTITITASKTNSKEREDEILVLPDDHESTKIEKNVFGQQQQQLQQQQQQKQQKQQILEDVLVTAEDVVVIPIVKESRSSSNPPNKPETGSRLKEEDKAKFKSLGDLHIEKGLPAVVPVPIDCDVDEDKKQLVLKAAHTLMKGVRSMMSRDKTLTITPKKSSSKSLSSVGLVRNQKPTLQLLSHTSFPGLPTYPVLAASHSSPWNC